MSELDKKVNIKNYTLYVLKLEDDKFYIGVTSKSPEERFEQHRNGYMGAKWTKLHRPIEIFDQKDLGLVMYEDAQKYENKAVRLYIERYGIENVRGGDLSRIDSYVKRFSWYWPKDSWELILYICAMTLVIMGLTIMYYLKP